MGSCHLNDAGFFVLVVAVCFLPWLTSCQFGTISQLPSGSSFSRAMAPGKCCFCVFANKVSETQSGLSNADQRCYLCIIVIIYM